MAFIKQEI